FRRVLFRSAAVKARTPSAAHPGGEHVRRWELALTVSWMGGSSLFETNEPWCASLSDKWRARCWLDPNHDKTADLSVGTRRALSLATADFFGRSRVRNVKEKMKDGKSQDEVRLRDCGQGRASVLDEGRCGLC